MVERRWLGGDEGEICKSQKKGGEQLRLTRRNSGVQQNFRFFYKNEMVKPQGIVQTPSQPYRNGQYRQIHSVCPKQYN